MAKDGPRYRNAFDSGVRRLHGLLSVDFMLDLQTTANQRPHFSREDDLVNVFESSRHIRIRELLTVLLEELLALFLFVLRSLNLVAKDDVDGSIRTHHCDLCRGPGVDEV